MRWKLSGVLTDTFAAAVEVGPGLWRMATTRSMGAKFGAGKPLVIAA